MRKSLSSIGVLVSAIAMVLSVAPSASAAAPAVAGGYRQINLISDIPGVARITDPHLVNPWGMSALPGGPLWVSDNGDNSSTLYTGADDGQPLAPALPVAIPAV